MHAQDPNSPGTFQCGPLTVNFITVRRVVAEKKSVDGRHDFHIMP
jgi:hypothetical protein